MKSGANTLSYQLYSDSSYSTIFQFTPPYQYAIPYNNSTGAVSNTTVYARVPAGQTLRRPATIPIHTPPRRRR